MNIDKIIVPLDVPTEAAAIALIDQLPEIIWWKVGLELFVSCGPKILSILKERQKRIFLDLKFHDIPNTVAGACRAAASYGVDLLTVHATAGRVALKAAQEAVVEAAKVTGQNPPRLIAITILTSLTSRDVAFDLKIPLELPEYVLQMALLAQESGLGGAVCSPQEVEQLRRVCGDDFVLVCPGVRPTWAEKGDQKRSLTPGQAIKAGADHLVIGRPITAAADPKKALERICQEI
ncbi:MAG: orotidine-5'-phosphate decarboxylase [Okeania sp. SIO2G4]|uniref:orotidine-5'-phosphate decarboxylase n=1 Tax=unclassified Okeania TaxID=2634635 RepID=UPI0013B5E9D7|nr:MULTISPECIES: orotidine-5'-phosphate decarboxylase [unclassified Okeania]NEP04241.1 orotidine-5'-phosphate decarboxylase [Okeania sp. SIO4D6]NEP38083.1 orotidine-5'-phosphate decarboxylase [Okeania sp. SIO2H7]NEP72795.1 orotidine-5'-phosphate decarboxylase [Okeania sp. SIO2G5]NEP93485.1 orotidine-5'-phosphate decarboxylase [Okeania sp. SIO2F5]NEQ89782.1 orotidine-5'-phosphate decarboxylase [Okeania sp. SIO2G4]